MKKVLSMIMASVMLTSSLSTMSAFAETTVEKCNGYTQTDIDVTVDAEVDGTVGICPYVEKHGDAEEIEGTITEVIKRESTPKIYVEVEWEELRFVYDFGTVVDYDWDIDDLKYEPIYEYANGESQGWNKESAKITFTNFSNRDVYTGVSFEKNTDEVYKDVDVTFDKEEVRLSTAVGGEASSEDITLKVDGAPLDCIDKDNVPSLGSVKFYISEHTRAVPEAPAEDTAPEEASGEHEHHFVYDQFGRLVCTGCNEIAHEVCIDMDEDGICDECGLERDFCEDCHYGGKCLCT